MSESLRKSWGNNFPQEKFRHKGDEYKRREKQKQQIPALFYNGYSEQQIATTLDLPINVVEIYIREHRLREYEERPDAQVGESEEYVVERLATLWREKIMALRGNKELEWTVGMISDEIGESLRMTTKIIAFLIAEGDIKSKRVTKLPPSRRVLPKRRY